MAKQRLQVIALQVPDLNTTVVGYRGEDGGSVRGPADIVDLFFKGLNLMADVLLLVLGVPDTHSPIVGASQENGALVLVPER
jgi:hypothetical protein